MPRSTGTRPTSHCDGSQPHVAATEDAAGGERTVGENGSLPSGNIGILFA